VDHGCQPVFVADPCQAMAQVSMLFARYTLNQTKQHRQEIAGQLREEGLRFSSQVQGRALYPERPLYPIDVTRDNL